MATREPFDLSSRVSLPSGSQADDNVLPETAPSSFRYSDGVIQELNVQEEEQQHPRQEQPLHEAPTIPTAPRYLGWTQVGALVRKNFLTKIRTPIGTLMEIFSPVLMMLILLAAYQLSEVTHEPEQQYDTINLTFPGPWVDLFSQSAAFLGQNNGSLSDLFTTGRSSNRPESGTPTSRHRRLEQGHGFMLLKNLEFDSLFHDRRRGRRRLQELKDNKTLAESNTSQSVFDVLDDGSDQLSSLLANPVPVPSIDQFVAASRALSRLIGDDELPIILSDSSYGRSWGNLLTMGTLHLSPASKDVVHEFHQYLIATYPIVTESVAIRLHETEQMALDFINNNLEERTWALLDFSQYVDEHDVRYKIRMNYTTLPNTNLLVDYVSIGLNTDYERYYLSGYLTLQRTLNEFAMQRLGCEADTSRVWSMPMPTAAYDQNAFFQVVGYLLGLTIAMAFLYPTSRTIKTMVEEKETRMKETLYILGVRPWAHWFSWLVTSVVVFAIISVLVTLTLTSDVLANSNPAYIFAFIGLFSAATIGFCFAIAACFSKAKLAAIVGPVALFATLLPRFIFFGSNRYEAIPAKIWASLLPCTAFAFGADIVADYEYAGVGVQSWNAGEGKYSFNTSLTMLFLDTILYSFLGWYLELIIPRQYGLARPWYFLCEPSYWTGVVRCCFQSGKPRKYSVSTEPGGSSNFADNAEAEQSDDFEAVRDPSWVPRVVIRNLTKKYGRKKDVHTAVDNLNLALYESQVTCLLGHNGAGKTTTIAVLSGLYPPTNGDCLIYGNSIVHNTNDARQSMGICPQHNVLFDCLTVTEHLNFFKRIKGITPSKAGVRHSASEVGLEEYLQTTSVALSGGNKRKLSLAIALCGDPQFLMLDEPTTGMSPDSRRVCWELLRRKRRGRVILLTTHFLDEASLLADRIAVMKEGKLQCCGSELFLKNRFGLGYNLTVVVDAAASAISSVFPPTSGEEEKLEEGSAVASNTVSHSFSDSVQAIGSFLNRYVDGTMLIRRSARELTFRFPQGKEESFPELFEALDRDRVNLSIGAYGISDTTLEEIFLQLAGLNSVSSETSNDPTTPEGQNRDAGDGSIMERSLTSNMEMDVPQSDLRPQSPLRQISLLYGKRFSIQKRDIKGACFQVFLPVLLCALVLLVLTIDVILAGPPIEMSLSLYRSGVDGVDTITDVVVGGGASVSLSDGRQLSVEDDFNSFNSVLYEDFPNANFVHLDWAESSSDVSQHLLDTYNDHEHNERYGSFALSDRINVTIIVDWKELQKGITDFIRSNSTNKVLGREGNLISTLLGVSEQILGFNFTSSNLENLIASLRNSTAANSTTLVAELLSRNSTQLILSSMSPSDAAMAANVLNELPDEVSASILGVLLVNEAPLELESFFESLTTFIPSATTETITGMNTEASILHNSTSPHAVGVFNQAYMEYLFKMCNGGNVNSHLVSINHPLPLTDQQTIEIKTILSILASLFLLIPFCYIPGAFIVFTVKETASKSKHLQLVSGVELTSYWVSSYMWDVTLFFVLTVLIMLVFLMYGQESAIVFVGDWQSFVASMALIFGYGMSILPFSYLLSRPFSNHSSAQIAVMGLIFITGFVAVNAYFIMYSIESTKEIALSLRPLFRWWPAYNLGEGLIELSTAYWEREILGSEKYPLDWEVTGRSLTLLYALTLPYFLLLLVLEYSSDGGAGGPIGRLLRRARAAYTNVILKWHGVRKGQDGISLLLDDGLDDQRPQDDDVLDEHVFVEQNKDRLVTEASVLLVNLWKVFPPTIGFFGRVMSHLRHLCELVCCCGCFRDLPETPADEDEDRSGIPKRAVRGVSTAIMEGETYGLLGVNGAGKTTILGVLTGDVFATGGQAYVGGHDVTGASPGGVAAARKKIGYCPQVDPLLDLLTGRETLRMFGRLRGIPEDRLEATVTDLLARLTLIPYADKVSDAYSGGNKRKLSLGIALIGNPRVLLIDEASSGMDPQTRRKTWTLIEEAAKTRSVVLTSHSMEEVEALCSRVGIMVKGQFICLGSIQHLKTKFLDGYSVSIGFEAGTPQFEIDHVLSTILSEVIPGSTLSEQHGRFLRFDVPSASCLGLGTMFRKFQGLKDSTSLETYSISQCTLEQVFIKLVKSGQVEPSEQENDNL